MFDYIPCLVNVHETKIGGEVWCWIRYSGQNTKYQKLKLLACFQTRICTLFVQHQVCHGFWSWDFDQGGTICGPARDHCLLSLMMVTMIRIVPERWNMVLICLKIDPVNFQHV